MPKISLVLFDMHDVLCRYDRELRIADLARRSGKSAAQVFAAIWQSGFETEADSGGLDAETYLREFGERLGHPITLSEWLQNRRLSMTPMPEVIALLRAVQARAAVAVLTNNHTLVREHLAELFAELAEICGDRFYVSAQFGAAKPAREVYLRGLAAAGAAPAETLFVDDSAANIAGAAEAGLPAHRFTDAAALRAVFVGYGLLER